MNATTEPTRPTAEPSNSVAYHVSAVRGATSWIPTPEASTAPWWVLGDCTCPDDCRIDHENA